MKNKITPVSQLAEVGACFDAREWVRSSRVRSLESAWLKCERGDWLLWYAAKRGVDRRTAVLAACACARLALPHAKSDLARICIETAEAWARGEATIEQVREARKRAAACASVYAAADAAAACAAVYAAVYAAAAAVYDAYAAAVYADDAAAAAVYAADADVCAVVYAADVCAAVYAVAERKQALAQCAQIVRKHIPTLPQ